MSRNLLKLCSMHTIEIWCIATSSQRICCWGGTMRSCLVTSALPKYSRVHALEVWLCGECPFYGNPTQVADQHRFATPPSLRLKVPAIPPDLELVMLTALAK